MARPKIDRSADIDKLLGRAEKARVQAVQLAERAGVNRVTLSRAKATGNIGLATLAKLETAMGAIEAERRA